MNSLLPRSALLALVVMVPMAMAQPYPAKPVRVVVPYAAGGPYDEIARVIGQRMSEMWGQPVIVDPRGGAAGGIGTDHVAKSAPDGYTLLLANAGPITINPNLLKKLPYDPQKDLAPVTMAVTAMMVLVVHPSLPSKLVKELVALARSNPGRLNYASAGVGNSQHIAMELLQGLAKVRMNHVPYKGAAPAFVDLIAGNVDLMFANVVGALPHIRSGRLRVVAVSQAKRAPVLAEVPSIAETYADFDMTTWAGYFVPAGTPKEVMAKLNSDIVKMLQRPDLKERFAAQGAEAVGSTPAELASFIRKETGVFAKVIQAAKIAAE
jgi:tripartite-type tricarboxylate transporter receptor subunit TctC